MKPRTLILFGALLFVVIGALAWFQLHQHHLNSNIFRGGMSADVKKRFLDNGVDCQETYELQGYEAGESLFRMFGLNQHEFYSLNPGSAAALGFKAGQVLCIRGIWGVTAPSEKAIAWFWPAVAVVAAVAGFLASKAVTAIQTINTPAPVVQPTPSATV